MYNDAETQCNTQCKKYNHYIFDQDLPNENKSKTVCSMIQIKLTRPSSSNCYYKSLHATFMADTQIGHTDGWMDRQNDRQID